MAKRSGRVYYSPFDEVPALHQRQSATEAIIMNSAENKQLPQHLLDGEIVVFDKSEM